MSVIFLSSQELPTDTSCLRADKKISVIPFLPPPVGGGFHRSVSTISNQNLIKHRSDGEPVGAVRSCRHLRKTAWAIAMAFAVKEIIHTIMEDGFDSPGGRRNIRPQNRHADNLFNCGDIRPFGRLDIIEAVNGPVEPMPCSQFLNRLSNRLASRQTDGTAPPEPPVPPLTPTQRKGR